MKKLLFIYFLVIFPFQAFAQLNVVSEMSKEESKNYSAYVAETNSSYVRLDDDGIYWMGSKFGAQDRSIAEQSESSKKYLTVLELKLGNKKQAIEYITYLNDWFDKNKNKSILTISQDDKELNIYKVDGNSIWISNGDADYLNERASEERQKIANAILIGKAKSYTNKSRSAEILNDIILTEINVKIFKKALPVLQGIGE